jgi:hypothetical protein
MIVASMIEAVIIPRFGTGARASLLTRRYPSAKNYRLLMISMVDEFHQTPIRRGWWSEIRWLGPEGNAAPVITENLQVPALRRGYAS